MAINETNPVQVSIESGDCPIHKEGNDVPNPTTPGVHDPGSSSVAQAVAVDSAAPSRIKGIDLDQDQTQSSDHCIGPEPIPERTRTKGSSRGVTSRRKGATLRADGRWQAVAYLGKTVKGKPYRKTYYGKTKSEALHKVEMARSAYLSGVITLDDRRTFREWTESWLVSSAPLNCKASTVTWYRDMLSRHAYPLLGNLKLQQIRAVHIDQVMASLDSQGKSVSTQRRVRSAISSVLADAERNELIQGNPVRRTRAPKRKDNAKTRDPEPFPSDQIPELVNCMSEDPRGIVYLFLLATGMRRGEALAVTWSDFGVSHEGFSVQVSRQLQECRITAPDGVSTVERKFSPPKTASGNRFVPITSELWESLCKHRLEQRANGLGWRDDELVFQSSTGTPIWPSNLTSSWAAFLKKNNLKHTQLHGLRHTFATLSLKNGAPLESVTQTLGHSRIEITKNLYAKRIPGAGRRSVEAFNPLSNEFVRSDIFDTGTND